VTEPISRTELYQQVNDLFYERFPDAPLKLKASDKPEWRKWWIETRDELLNEEVNRVYWARHPDAPTELDSTSPEWEPWREKWNAIWKEVMDNAPAPEDVEYQNAVSDTGELDLSHLKARIREQAVDLANEGMLLADTRDEVIEAADKLADEVGAMAMEAGTVDGEWESEPAEVKGPGTQVVKIWVTGRWDSHYFTGSMATLISGDQLGP
jgi:hypothetical protein